MTSAKLVVYLTCLFLGEMAQATYQESNSLHQQESGFVTANVGENLTLQCFYGQDEPRRIYWFKQSLGERPRLMSSLYVSSKSVTFLNEFKNNPRFTLEAETGKNHLKISDLHTSDSATYHCAKRITTNTKFVRGILVSVKGMGLNIPALVHQSASETTQPGGSVSLNCTVYKGTYDGEHSVYWFKSSEKSHPGLIYTHKGRNDQCGRNTQTQSCVYNLPMVNLDPSHAATYYCAVASCGHKLFGDGTKLEFVEDVDSFVLVYVLSGALTFTTILAVLLAVTLYRMANRNNCQCTEIFPAPSAAIAKGYQHEQKLYNGFTVNLRNRRRQWDQTWSECVYYSIKQ